MAYIWADVALWYQYDSLNPKHPSKIDGGISTNYRNYFLCSDAGLTLKPIDFTITLTVKLQNCYKVLIQSFTDWSNWAKVGP